MNLNKHRTFFDPDKIENEIHVIGCGAVGSTIIEQLARLGIHQIHIYDFDIVAEHNITNQMFLNKHIGKPKTDAVKEIAESINPEINIIVHEQGWSKGMPLSGYVFMAVDSIQTRKDIVNDNIINDRILIMFDTRMRLLDAQAYAYRWTTSNIKTFLKTMNFTDEEAKQATPVSACGTTLSVTPTVRVICGLEIANFIKCCLNIEDIKNLILLDLNTFNVDII